MRTDETFLHSMAAHHTKRHDTRSRFEREAVHSLEIIGEIQRTTIKLHMTIWAQAENVAIDVRTTLRTTESMNVCPFGVIFPTRIYS
ncbi:hypothetical protein AMK20_07665 [Streptomyces sp. TSRI0261]|nr:hypothetical protein AMK20_07665 [Streptomyces sp. TSRI0261]